MVVKFMYWVHVDNQYCLEIQSVFSVLTVHIQGAVFPEKFADGGENTTQRELLKWDDPDPHTAILHTSHDFVSVSIWLYMKVGTHSPLVNSKNC